MELLRDTSAADHAAPFQHAHAQARHAQIGRTGQPVVTGANYTGIEIGHGAREELGGMDVLRWRSSTINNILRSIGHADQRLPIRRLGGVTTYWTTVQSTAIGKFDRNRGSLLRHSRGR